jgi:hypothetical protein
VNLCTATAVDPRPERRDCFSLHHNA